MEMCANIWRLNSALPQPRADGQTDTPKTIKAALDMHETDVHCRACHMTQVNAREPEHLSVPRPQTISVAAWGRRRTSEWCRCCYVVVQKSLFYMDPWWQFYRRLKCLIWRFQSSHRPFFFQLETHVDSEEKNEWEDFTLPFNITVCNWQLEHPPVVKYIYRCQYRCLLCLDDSDSAT